MCKWTPYLLVIILAAVPGHVFAVVCSRYPSNTMTPKVPVDENFAISVTGNAQSYLLGQTYNISLQSYNGRRFVGAKLALETDNGDMLNTVLLGRLEVIDPVETRFSADCINMIETTNTNPKTRIDMVYVAPLEPGAGCVLIRATVLQHRDVWFMDDGSLTKRICEESVDDMEGQKRDDTQKECCACDEARYEITFEGVWSRNLHPKDFPMKGWITRFSDILGAAHTSDYRFWDSGVLASRGLQEFAEHGSSRGLERELNNNFKAKKVRTILKARGPTFPYMNSPTVAWIRVDRARHQVSLASKIVPSPDWIVGVSGMELCLSNCTWIEEKVISLYPWDIGTDAGPSYISADQPQLPPDVIRRIRSDYPSDPRSPFFDPTGLPMKPMALLTIKRQRVYDRKCDEEDSNNAEDVPRECQTHPWADWSECNTVCGTGERFRTRVFKQPEVANIYNCDEMVERRQVESCTVDCQNLENPWVPEDEEDNLMRSLQPLIRPTEMNNACLSGEWSDWSRCNATCGTGYQRSKRLFSDPLLERECQTEMYRYQKCFISNTLCLGSNYPSVIGDTGADSDSDLYNGEGDEGGDEDFNDYSRRSYVTESAFPSENLQSNSQFGRRTYSNSNDFSNIRAENLKQEPPYDDYKATESQYPNRNGNFQYLRGAGNQISSVERKPRPAHQTSFPQDFDKIQGYQTHYDHANVFQKVPPYHCYQPLTMTECSDGRVVGNFWFYNVCTDECMLYAADICDRNANRFTSLEKCEESCARPMRNSPTFLRHKQQQSAHCQRVPRNSRQRGYIV